jgi:paraquat-inducible protein A
MVISHAPHTSAAQTLTACHECDLLQYETELSVGRIQTCRRCGGVLYKNAPNGLERALACLSGAAILFVVSSIFPIVSLELQGNYTTATLLGTVYALYSQDMALVAGLVLLTTLLMPALEILAKLYMLVPLHLGFTPPGFSSTFRLMRGVHQWGMIDVFIIGILVSLVKLADLAVIVPGIAIWSFASMIILLAAAAMFFDSHTLWEMAASTRKDLNTPKHMGRSSV